MDDEKGGQERALEFYFSGEGGWLAQGEVEEIHHSALQPEAPPVQKFDLPAGQDFNSGKLPNSSLIVHPYSSL